MSYRLLSLLGFIFSFQITHSQVEQELNPPDYIKTITFQGQTNESQLPILRLGENLLLEFDVLNGNEDDFYYKIEHFNYDWTPSQLMRTEFLSGYDNQRIRFYENSFNTYQIYSHYMLRLPNERTRGLKVSGNYMVKVFNDLDELVFSRKFMVNESGVGVGVAIKRSRDVKFIEEKQSVDIVINSNSMLLSNPTQTVNTVIIQNNNLNTAIYNVKPQYSIGNELISKYNTETSFFAGNEYFFFENKDIRGANSNIQFIELGDLYNNYLFTNVARRNRPYTYNPDINGNFLITAIDVEKPYIEADYAWIHFSLLMNKLPNNQSVHVYGNFNNYAIDESTKMTYNDKHSIYEVPILLKQGFYNYKYVVVNNATGKLDEGAIGGNFWQTENDYKVVVYYRDLGGRYDRIIGVGQGNSVDISN
ncbi:DUF5103 domain-containing protein [Hanstruepera neustonica]|uniref:DUF5103 domain-containing protein n=1 Tax=Hanstruepera neustonica TaxID=1445657 RepID=A0A2K1E4X0_9FLAO|nr:DUF5103 domain-containing protein [Hanstruepera neustonica]PNQ75281.1 DUF5103 domain-containing protein [Hanstruepera neustonica]